MIWIVHKSRDFHHLTHTLLAKNASGANKKPWRAMVRGAAGNGTSRGVDTALVDAPNFGIGSAAAACCTW